MPTPLNLPPLAHPGLLLAPTTTHTAGPGTHIHNSQIYASISGRPTILPSSSKGSNPRLSIPRLLPSSTHAPIPSSYVSNTNTLPMVGDMVLARVQKVRVRQVEVVVLCVGLGGNVTGKGDELADGGETQWAVCSDDWPAVVRREDVRASEKEKVVTSEGFRVGDIVRGVVISLGDQANYYLTTARNELGVMMAKSETGNTMFPISWKEFRDPVTGEAESRKVAKPL